MSNFLMRLLKSVVIGWALLVQNVFAQGSMDGYYSSDLLDAVHEAKQSTHHYDYSNTYRYKRTTAQSIELNRMDLEEMEDASLENSLNTKLTKNPDQPEAPPELDTLSTDSDLVYRSNERQANQPQYEFPKKTIVLEIGSSISPNGELSTHGVQSSSTLVSTPRP